MLQSDLYTLITDDVGVSALIGTTSSRSDKTSGLFLSQAKQNSPQPLIVYTQISGNTVPMMEGASALQPARLQFACYGDTPEDAKTLARSMKKLLVGLNTTFASGVRVDYCSLALELDAYEEAPGSYVTQLDFEFLFADTDGD